MRISTVGPLLGIEVDAAAPAPLYRQLYDSLRGAILERRLQPGTRLPPTRAMARHLGLSRNTIVLAYEQLLVEGYVEARVGFGTCVTRSLGRTMLPRDNGTQKGTQGNGLHGTELSKRGRRLSKEPVPLLQSADAPRAFEAGLPDPSVFPFSLWARLAARRWRSCSYGMTTYGDPAGYPPLRQAIAHYLRMWRGVQCTVEQVVIVSGSQSAIDLAVRLLTDSGGSALIENPGYRGARAALHGAGVKLFALPVDGEGADILNCGSLPRNIRLAYVTPSHQYPLGVTMSLKRRLALLDWARRQRAWILEDDYDSEYSYRHKPLPALQGLDPSGRVIYIGTFSKTLFPSLRLGFLIAPPSLVDSFRQAQSVVCCHSPLPDQAILADFITQGHFARHLARMRNLYGEKRSLLLQYITAELGGLVHVEGADAGLHVAALLSNDVDDESASRSAALRGVFTTPLSCCDLSGKSRPGLLLGYAALTNDQIRDGVKTLAKTLLEKQRSIPRTKQGTPANVRDLPIQSCPKHFSGGMKSHMFPPSSTGANRQP